MPEYEPKTIDHETVVAILDAIPWEKRGLFLMMATEAVRISEARAYELEDLRARDGAIRLKKWDTRGIQGSPTSPPRR